MTAAGEPALVIIQMRYVAVVSVSRPALSLVELCVVILVQIVVSQKAEDLNVEILPVRLEIMLFFVATKNVVLMVRGGLAAHALHHKFVLRLVSAVQVIVILVQALLQLIGPYVAEQPVVIRILKFVAMAFANRMVLIFCVAHRAANQGMCVMAGNV